ncbi:VWA domain-containing protein, partial [Sedimentibacter sp.]
MNKPNILKKVLCFTIALLMLIPSMPGNMVSAAEAAKYPGTGSPAGSGTNWNNSGRIVSNDNNYASVSLSSSGTSRYLKGSNYGFNIPDGATIDGIEVIIGRYSSTGILGGRIRDSEVKLVKNGDVQAANKAATTTDWPNGEGAARYGDSNDLWNTSWTPADINNNNFGVVLSVRNNADYERTAYVDYMQIKVYYTEQPEDPPTEEDIELTKEVEELSDGTYELTLSVKGKDITKYTDIVLILDNSNSMTSSLVNMTEAAAKKFASEILNSSIDARIAVVRYGSTASAYNFNSGSWTSYGNSFSSNHFSTDLSKINTAINALAGNGGGTNTEGGFLVANQLHSLKRSNADFVTVFMTDGVPTYHYTSGSNYDGGGNRTTVSDFNEALTAAIALKNKTDSTIYNVGLIGALTGNDVTIAQKFMQQPPFSMINTNPSFSSAPSESYAVAYYPITSTNSTVAETEIIKIYTEIASKISAMATGTVIDTIPWYFELTPESVAALIADGVDIDEDADGNTILTFYDIPAGDDAYELTPYAIEPINGVYGTAYTNKDADGKSAIYDYTFNTPGGGVGTKEFPQPLVVLNPIANDDPTATGEYYTTNMDSVLTVNKETGILANDKIDEDKILDDDGYTISELMVHTVVSDEEIVIGTQGTVEIYEKGTLNIAGTVIINDDGSFVFTPTDGFTGLAEFQYKNFVNINKTDDDKDINDNYLSNLATVTINVLPSRTLTINYYERTTSEDILLDSENETLFEGQDVDKTAPDITGFTFDEAEHSGLIGAVINVNNVKGKMPAGPATINFYYTRSSFNYSIEYYYNGVKDDSKTE